MDKLFSFLGGFRGVFLFSSVFLLGMVQGHVPFSKEQLDLTEQTKINKLVNFSLNYTTSNYTQPVESDHNPFYQKLFFPYQGISPVVAPDSSASDHENSEILEENLPEWQPPQISNPEHLDDTENLTVPEGNWLPYTLVGVEGDTYMENDGIFVSNRGKVQLEPEDLAVFSSFQLEIGEDASAVAPQILILHSHATESYAQFPGYNYLESDPYRTLDASQNILQVGAAMAEELTLAGFSVIHDKTLHDYPDYNASYQNSAETVTQYLEKYPSISLVLDVHRDALSGAEGIPYQLLSQQEGGEVAQVMLVVGSDGDGYTHDSWRENFSLAVTLQRDLLEYGDFARPIALRSGRFNQHLSTGSLLVEVGGHGNTLPQAISAGRLLAQSLAATLRAS